MFPGNATSTKLTFSGGLLSTASTTIGDGTAAGGLTVSGGATTTGYLVVQGNATSTFSGALAATYLNVTGTSATSTFARGIDLSGGCFSILGTCVGGASSQWTTSGNDIYYTTGNVGIASSSPWGLLSVNPNGITGPAFVIGSSTATKFIVDNGGNVGIGTTTPAYNLDVYGNIRATSQLRADVVSGTAPLAVNSITKVANLNADLLDGFDSSAFGDATAANQTTILDRIGTSVDATTTPSAAASLFAGIKFLANRQHKMQTFTSDGTWTWPGSTVSVVYVSMVGGGGGGGGALGGGGGGGKSYTRYPVAVSGDVSVTIGAGGAGNTGASTGDSGGDSVFSTVTANGGFGGAAPNANGGKSGSGVAGGVGGASPTAGGNSVGEALGASGAGGGGGGGTNASGAGGGNAGGGGGGAGGGGAGSGGGGGASSFGSGGAGGSNSVNGSSASSNSGAGGGGGGYSIGDGGSGGSGIAIVEWFE